MATLTPKKINLSTINGGNEYELNDGIQPSTINDLVEGIGYDNEAIEALLQTPDTTDANVVGTPIVTLIETTLNGRTYYKFKFSNLKGEQGEQGEAGSGSSVTLDTQVSTTSTNGVQNQAITNYVNNEITSAIGNTSNLLGNTEDLSYGTQATLNAPTISLSGSTLTLTNPTTNGDFAQGFHIYNGTTLLSTQLIDVTTLDLSTLLTEEGTYTITAKCYGTNMSESNASSSVSYVIEPEPTPEPICLTGDMLITMANGSQKRIDQLSIGEYVLGFDKKTMELVPCRITYSDAQMNKSYKEYNIWTLSDGTILKTVHNHRFYCLENEAMTYVLPNEVMKEWQIGQHFVKADGTTPTLVKHETIKEKVNHYTIFCENNNYFVNGILSGNRYTKLSGVPFKQ